MTSKIDRAVEAIDILISLKKFHRNTIDLADMEEIKSILTADEVQEPDYVEGKLTFKDGKLVGKHSVLQYNTTYAFEATKRKEWLFPRK